MCSLEEVVAGIWEVQDHIDALADMDDNPRGLQHGLAGLSAVIEQRTKLQVPLLNFKVQQAADRISLGAQVILMSGWWFRKHTAADHASQTWIHRNTDALPLRAFVR